MRLLRRLRGDRRRSRRGHPRRGREGGHRALAGGDGLQVQGRRGDGRQVHLRDAAQRRHPHLRAGGDGGPAAAQEPVPDRLRRLRAPGRHPGAGQPVFARADPEVQLRGLALDGQPEQDPSAAPLRGGRSHAASAGVPQRGAHAGSGGGRGLLHPGLSAHAEPDQGRVRRPAERQPAAQGLGAGAGHRAVRRMRAQGDASRPTSPSPSSSARTRSCSIPSSAFWPRAWSAWDRPRAAAAGRPAPAATCPAPAASARPRACATRARRCSRRLCANIAAKDEAGIQKTLDGIPDPVGTFYRYGLAKSILRRKVDLPTSGNGH